MERLDLEDGFDVHDHRSELKLQRQDEDSMALANRGGLACPSCERPFERLFVTTAAQVTFDSGPGGPICVVRTDDELLVLTH